MSDQAPESVVRTLPGPASLSAPSGRMSAMFGDLLSAPRQTEEQKDQPTSREQRMLRKHSAQAEFSRVLGQVMTRATSLQLVGGRVIGPARDRQGRVLRWSFWAPSRMVLIDRFKREMPPVEELEDRRDFAQANDIKYAVVGPGAALTTRDVAEWLEPAGEEGAR